MTAHDPRSRPFEGHETPLYGTATTRTDTTVHPHDADADALDAWLESLIADNAGEIGHNGHANGGPPHRSMSPAGDTPLVATARSFHARMEKAEAAHAGGIPETVIWERIMSSQLTAKQPAVMQGRVAPTEKTRPGQRDVDVTRPAPILDRFTGGHPAFSAVLAAAVILAIVAIFRVIGAPPSGPTDNPTTGPNPNVNPALAAVSTPSIPPPGTLLSSPIASPAASDTERWIADPDAATCELDTAIPPGAVDGDWTGFAPPEGPLPFSDTTPGNRTAAAEVYLQFRICSNDEHPATDALISDAFAELLTAEDGDMPPEQETLSRQISDAYANEDPMSFVIEGEPLPRDASSPGYGSASRRVLLPDDVVRLADGRIGGPAHVFLRTNHPDGAAGYLAPAGFLETGFIVFTAEDGRWVIDDALLICIGDCDDYWTSRYPGSTPATAAGSGDLALLGATGSLIVGDETDLLRVPLDGGAPDVLQEGASSSAIRTSYPNVVIRDDGRGTQFAQNVSTGIASKNFPTQNIISVWNVGPYRVIGYADPADLLVVDLRTMRLTSLADLNGGSVGISDPAFSVQGDESGNLIVGISPAGNPGSTSAVAAFIDRDAAHVRILEGWTASGQGGVLARSPRTAHRSPTPRSVTDRSCSGPRRSLVTPSATMRGAGHRGYSGWPSSTRRT